MIPPYIRSFDSLRVSLFCLSDPATSCRSFDLFRSFYHRTGFSVHPRRLSSYLIFFLPFVTSSDASEKQSKKRAASCFVSFTIFEPDQRKSGRRYVMIIDAVKHVDPIAKQIELLSSESTDPLSRHKEVNRKIRTNRISRIEIRENRN